MSAIAATPREMVIDTRAVTSLESELVDAKKQLVKVSDKTKKYKDVNEKLRLELESRRVKEKWDLGIMDVEDRKSEMRMVALEFEISQLRATVGIQEIDQEGFEVSSLIRVLCAVLIVFCGDRKLSKDCKRRSRL